MSSLSMVSPQLAAYYKFFSASARYTIASSYISLSFYLDALLFSYFIRWLKFSILLLVYLGLLSFSEAVRLYRRFVSLVIRLPKCCFAMIARRKFFPIEITFYLNIITYFNLDIVNFITHSFHMPSIPFLCLLKYPLIKQKSIWLWH